jgi:hypothetical protein
LLTTDDEGDKEMKTNRTLKYILITIGVVTVLFIIGFCSLAYHYRPKGPSEFDTIRKLEEKNMNSEIITKLNNSKDIDGFLLNNLFNFSNQEDMLILSWLLNRETKGKTPFLYYHASLFFAKQKKRYEALNLIALARLTSRIDCARCSDSSTNNVYLAAESTVFNQLIKAFENNNKRDKLAAIMWALFYEEKMKDRPSICPEMIPKEEWEVKRSGIRKEFLSP